MHNTISKWYIDCESINMTIPITPMLPGPSPFNYHKEVKTLI